MVTPPRSPRLAAFHNPSSAARSGAAAAAAAAAEPPAQAASMRPESPRANLVLPPPIHLARPPHSQKEVRGDMTLPPLSTVSPLVRPAGTSETAAFSLSNLVHQSEPTPNPNPDPKPPSGSESSWKTRDRRELSPCAGPSRRPFDPYTETEKAPTLAVAGDPTRRAVRPRVSVPDHQVYVPRVYEQAEASTSRMLEPVPPPPSHPDQRIYEPRRAIVHPTATTTAPPITHPQQWTTHPPPHPHSQSQPQAYAAPTYRHRRSSSIAEAWFAVGDLPPRQQYGWSRDRVEGYHAGWEDALRSVEAGVFGVGGQQYLRPILVRKDIPPPHTVLGPPSLRQSSSSDPGPYVPINSASQGMAFEPPPPAVPRSMSFSSNHPPPPPPLAYTYRRPATAVAPGVGPGTFAPGPVGVQQRHSYSSTSVSLSLSPTSPSSTGERERERKHRQAISCYPCRGRKLKCDGERPCSQCVRRGGAGDCEYASSVRRRGKGKKGGGKSQDGEDDESVASQEGEA